MNTLSFSNNQAQVIIDPRFSYLYGSFYLRGLVQVFGWRKIHFSITPFKSLPNPGWNIRFIIKDSHSEKKYFIHTNDSYHVDKENYNWCDIYGHVNSNFSHYSQEQYPKIISLVPSFGIRTTSLLHTMMIAMRNFVISFKDILSTQEWNKWKNIHEINKWKNIKHFFGRYYKAYKNRLPYQMYEQHLPVKEYYIFFLSTLWYDNKDNNNNRGVNLRRAHFIRACKALQEVDFEGGLLADASSTKEEFQDVLAANSVQFDKWLQKTKSSTLVFNTPAFWDCHGWKLGEYLALGKCIISTPLSNDLPAPLLHGEHIHFVDNNQDAMLEAIHYIISHPEYRIKLENGARRYWSEYGTPIQALRLLGIIK